MPQLKSSTGQQSARLLFVTGLITFVAISAALWYFAWKQYPDIADENHSLEWTQIVLLLAATVMFLVKSSRAITTSDRFAWCGMGLLCISFAQRELPIREMIAGSLGETLHTGTRVAMFIMWIPYAWLAIGRLSVLWPAFWRFCTSITGVLVMTAGAFFVAAIPSDKFQFSIQGLSYGFIEELLEFHGAFILFVAAMVAPTAAKADDARRSGSTTSTS